MWNEFVHVPVNAQQKHKAKVYGDQRDYMRQSLQSKITTLYIKANKIFIHVTFLKITRVDHP